MMPDQPNYTLYSLKKTHQVSFGYDDDGRLLGNL